MKKKIVDWVQQTLNGLKNESKKKIVSLGLIGIILLSAVSFSLFDAMFGPKKVTPAELVDIVFEKYDLEYQEEVRSNSSGLFGAIFDHPERYVCNIKPNIKESDLEQEFAVVGVIRNGYCITGGYGGIETYVVSMDTDKKINDNRFSGEFFSFTLYLNNNPSEKKHKDYIITKKNWEVLENIHKGDKIKIKLKLKNISEITPYGTIYIKELGNGYNRIAVEKYY